MWRCAVVLMGAAMVLGTCASEEALMNVTQAPAASALPGVDNNSLGKNKTEQSVRQLWKRCFHKLSSRCVKLTMARLLEYLPVSGLHVVPGLTLLANSSDSLQALEKLRGLLTADSSGLRLLASLRQFFSSLTVRVRLEDSSLLREVKSLSEEVVDNLVAPGGTEGRKKGEGVAMMWAGGALAAAGFAALAAMAGKAMMASMAALMLAAMSALRGGGGGGGGGGEKHSHVEIIKAPAHYELAPMPVHHEGGYAFEHDHYYAPSNDYGGTTFVNKRRLEKGVVTPSS